MKKQLTKITVTLIMLCFLASAAAMMPIANAQEQALVLNPTEGPVGQFVSVIGMGFAANTQVSVSFGTTHVANGYTGSMFGRMSTSFSVPNVALGTYTISATDDAGGYAETTFTVIEKTTSPTPKPTATPTPATSPTPGGTQTSPAPSTSPTSTNPTGTNPTQSSYPYYTPKPSKTPIPSSAEFWSPTMIGIVVAVVIASGIIVTFFVMRRGKPEPYYDEGRPSYGPDASGPSNYPPPTSRYNQPPGSSQPPSSQGQPSSGYSSSYSRSSSSMRYGQQQYSRPVSSMRYNQPSSGYGSSYGRSSSSMRYGQSSRYGQSGSSTRVCPRCKRAVRDDYNLCPYCDMRLR